MEHEVVKYETEKGIQLGTLWVASPEAVVARASSIASALAEIIEQRKLFNIISRRKYVRVEGWSTLGAMMGVLPREVEVAERENGDFEAVVELIRASDGVVVGRGSAICGMDERTWANRERFARRSMAVTRATGKAFRLGFSWIVQLAGYEATPAEEMDGLVVDAEVTELPRKPAKATPKPDPTNGAIKKAWFLKVLDTITYYRATNHVVNTLKQLGYEAFEPDKADEMYEALQAHAKAKADAEAA